MNESTIRIDALNLRVPGLHPRDARQFAAQVAQQLAVQLPAGVPPQQIGKLQVRLQSPESARPDLPTTIARSIATRIT